MYFQNKENYREDYRENYREDYHDNQLMGSTPPKKHTPKWVPWVIGIVVVLVVLLVIFMMMKKKKPAQSFGFKFY